MYNLYSCGCHVEQDVPVLSRCAEHNGFVVAAFEHARSREVVKTDRLTVWHDTQEANYQKLPSEKFDHVFCYPEHNTFYAYQQMTNKAWRDREDPMFAAMRRVLKPKGYATLVVDYSALHTVLYQAGMVGFDYNIGPTLYREFVPEPLYSRSYEFADAKVMVDFFVGSRRRIPESGGYVLDMSSILLDRTMRRAKDNKVLALCSCPHRFRLIKKSMRL